MNIGFVLLGLGSAASVLRHDLHYERGAALAVALLSLLSFELIRTFTHPLSDVPFFGLALFALALASAARRRGNLGLLLSAGVVIVAATSVRTIGIALVPMLVAALPTPRTRWIVAPLALVLGVVALAFLAPRRYLDDASEEWGDEPLRQLVDHVRELFGALGQLALNMPDERVPGAVDALFPVVGALVLVAVVGGALLLRRRAPVPAVLLLSFVVLPLAWPLAATRLLLPTVPLLIACVVEAARALRRRRVVELTIPWAAGYVAVGLVALWVTTGISFAAERFPDA